MHQRDIEEWMNVREPKKIVFVSLVLATVVLGMCATSVSHGKPKSYRTLGEKLFDMNDDISWKDADSYWEEGSDKTMLMNQATMWNSYDYAEARYTGWLSSYTYSSIYCYGWRTGYNNAITLWVKTSNDSDYVEKATKTCTYQTWTILTWGTDIWRSTDTKFKFKLYNGFVIVKPYSGWGNAVIKIDPQIHPDRYFDMTNTKFHNVDSCYDGRTDCPDLHAEVSNHVVFLHTNDYLLTKKWRPGGLGPSSPQTFKIYAKCLTSSCKVNTHVHWYTETGSGTYYIGQFTFSGGWGWVYVGYRFCQVNIDWTLQITNAVSTSEFIWNQVKIEYPGT